jgi:iron complex outermembrane recepter protein
MVCIRRLLAASEDQPAQVPHLPRPDTQRPTRGGTKRYLRRRREWAVIAGALLVLLYARAGVGQEASSSDVLDRLEEVTVTAQRRASTAQDTPISLTVVSAQDILDRGFSDFTALAQSIPGVSMRTSGPGQTELGMRGITSTGGNSATVGFYLDDIPLSAPAASQNGKVIIDPNLYDLARVEVLRGPQGTLYGSGSMGGTIRLITHAPDPRAFGVSAETVLSDTSGGSLNHGENAMVNLPFAGGTTALRLVGSEEHDSGWISRIVIADGQFPLETQNDTVRGNVLAAPLAREYPRVNDEELHSARARLLWQPTDRLSVTPSIYYQRITQGGLNDIDSPPGAAAHYQPFDIPEPFSDRVTIYSLNAQYHFDAFDLTSTSSRWTREEDLRQDGTESYQWAFGGGPFDVVQGGLGPATPTPLEVDRSRQSSEELRLTSTAAGRFKWLVGYFYGDFASDFDLFVLMPGAAPLFGTEDAYTQTLTYKIIQNSVFSEISYQLTPALTATAGLRRYSYDASLAIDYSGFLSSTGSDAAAFAAEGASSQGVNPKFELSYQATKALLLYLTAAKGFRPGGANAPVPTSGPLGTQCEAQLQANHGTTSFVAAPLTYEPDHLWSYELGEKLWVFDNRLSLNGAVYYEDWSAVQQAVVLPCGFPYNDNSGIAHVYGGELEIGAVLLPGLIVSGNAGYTHATLAVGSLEAGIAAGTRLQDVPEWTSSASLTYRRGLGNGLALRASLNNEFVGSRTDATFSINQLPSYDLSNVRIGLEGRRWSATLFAKNLLNREARLSDAPAININQETFNRISVSPPRTIGIDLSWRL